MGVVAAACAALLGLAGSAQAASPYIASSSGSGVMCTDAAPCNIQQAVSIANMAGDQVLLKNDGPHDLTGTGVLVADGGITVRPQTPGTRPTITSTDGSRVFINGGGSVLQDVRVSVTGLPAALSALQIDAGSAFRVEVFGNGMSRR